MPAQSAGPPTQFAFFTCQIGAEGAVKAEIGRSRPDWRLAFSRPGFLTFKTAGAAEEELRSLAPPTFARARGESLGMISGETPDQAAAKVWQLVDPGQFDRLHVWQRDVAPPGRHGFEPLPAAPAGEAIATLRAALERDPRSLGRAMSFDAAAVGQRVLDCVIVEPDQWWIGRHDAGDDPATGWVGGVPAIDLPAEAVSCAYLKMEERFAGRESAVPRRAALGRNRLRPGRRRQALLDRGMTVLGIDPAEVDPRLAADPRFTHLRMRAADVRRRAFRNIRWLAADVNLAPETTLDAVEAIVTHAAVAVEGMVLTLKLLDWSLARQLPDYLERIRSWGYPRIQARQLAFNRQEVCVAATRPPRPRTVERGGATKRRTPSRLKRRRKRLE